MIKDSIRKILAGVLTAVLMLVFGLGATEGFSPLESEEIKLNFTVLSDCHIESNNFTTYRTFARMLRDAKSSETPNDAIVFLGDNTMNGQEIESLFFYGAVNYIQPANQVINALGNHDIGNGEGDYDELLSRYLGYSNAFFELGINKPYYYKVINGCYFIVLATEKQTVNTAYISDEQYSWLRTVLDEAAEENAPIFVFNHHPIYYLEGDANALWEILEDYNNLLYFCGHTHFQMSEGSFSNYNGVDTIWLPRSTESVDYEQQVGVQVEVYETEVVVRARNFYSGEWLEELEYTYEID